MRQRKYSCSLRSLLWAGALRNPCTRPPNPPNSDASRGIRGGDPYLRSSGKPRRVGGNRDAPVTTTVRDLQRPLAAIVSLSRVRARMPEISSQHTQKPREWRAVRGVGLPAECPASPRVKSTNALFIRAPPQSARPGLLAEFKTTWGWADACHPEDEGKRK